jgi:hypothetical protein
LGEVKWGKGHQEILCDNFVFVCSFVCLFVFKVFAILEEAKVLFKLEDYSVKRVTLEQIFLTFANTDKMRTYQEIKLQ